MANASDADYLKIVLNPIYVCAHYRPKFGQGAKGGGLTLSQFQTLYQGDPFYSWFGLDNPLMYAAHKGAFFKILSVYQIAMSGGLMKFPP